MSRRMTYWAARTTVTDRIARGSATLWNQRAEALAAWVRAGRRDDLDGWRASLGPLLRVALLTGLAYALWAAVRAWPWLMWALAGWWLRAAWKAGRAAPEEPPAEAPAPPDVEAVRTLLLTLMGTGSAVHLNTVLAHLQEHGQWEGRTVTDLRLHLARLGVPHDHRVKVGKVPTWGVRRRDLVTPSPAESQTSPTEASPAA